MLNPLKLISKIFKSSNQKQLDQLQAIVEQVNNYEKNISSLTNEEFPKKTANFFASVPFPEDAVPSIAITGNLF